MPNTSPKANSTHSRDSRAPRAPGPDPLQLRATPRVAMDAAVEIHARGHAGALSAQLHDLSIGGACIATSVRIDPATIDHLVISFTQGVLQLPARGCWQRDDPSDQRVYTGVTFEGLDAEGEDRLWQIVLDHGRDLAHFLHRHSDLRELGIEEAIGLSQASRRRELVSGSAIYRQGHEADGEDSIFLLLAGRVTLEVRVRDARNVPYATLEPGDLFGGHPLVARTPNPDSAICESDCQLLEIDRDAFRYLRISKPWTAIQLASAVLRVSSVRLGRMVGAVSETR